MTEPVAPSTKKYPKSGHCGLGHHEGTKPVSPSGKAHKTCDQLDWCSCECHVKINEMFAMSGKPRRLITNPDYRPYVRDYQMPSLEDSASELSGVAPILYDGEKPPEFTPTPSGRTTKGMLEYWVKEVAEAWLEEEDRPSLTPAEISARIQKVNDLEKAPSPGAVHSVLMRWETIGYALIERNPIRFLSKTREGMKNGLDVLKAKAKIGG
jgi:hypothetical protein